MKKRVLSLLLCIVLCLGLCVPALGAYNDDVTVSASLDKAEIDYDAKNDQTVKVTVSLSKEVEIFSMSMRTEVPKGLTLAGIEGGFTELEEGNHYNLTTGKISWYAGKNLSAKDLVILSVTIPAGTAVGDYTIGVNTIKLATSGQNDDKNWMNGTSASVTLKIKDAAPTYTISFDANGGTGTMADVTGVSGSYTLPECKFTAPDGQQFKAWSVDGKEYKVGASITVNANTTVKAVWEDIPVETFTVSFDANGGTGTMADVTGVSGDYTLPECGFTAPDGQQFKAWSVDGKEYKVGASITVSANTTVKAVWEDIPVVTYTVSFDANGGSGSMADVTGVSGDYTLPECGFTAPDGQQFKAWSVNGKEYAAGAAVTLSADATVKAIWEDIPVTYTVSFDANGGTGTMADVTVNVGDYTLPECDFTAPKGMEYKAWQIGEDEYQPSNIYKVDADTIVIALWQEAPVVIETVATPKLPKSGEFSGSKTVTITCATKGADIYYTTDGTTPSAASTLYTGSFSISATTTVKAIAIKAGMNDSEIASATYTLYSDGGGWDDYGTIRVSMRLIGAELAKQDVDLGKSSYLPAYVTWISTTSYTLNEGATVYDLFVKATAQAGIRSVGADNNYVETIFAPSSLGGYELSEFTNGKRSGWMYTINGSHPGFGLKEQKLRDGDVVIWHYVNDYSYEVADWTSEGKWQALGDGTYYNGWLKAPDRFGAESTSKEEEEEKENTARFENGVVTLEAETESGTASAKLDKETAETGLKLSKSKDQLTVEVENKSASRIILSVDSDAAKAIADAKNALRVETDKGCVTLGNADVAALAKNGQEVRIIVEDQSGGAEKVTVTVGNKVADISLQVELPAPKDGQVLVLVNADGTEKVIKKSVVENGKAYGEISNGATVKVVANKKTFKDVKDSDWFASAVDFVSSHELFQGVGDGEFAPKSNMTRAMLVTVLYRLQDEPKTAGKASFNDVPADTWYTEAVAWAAGEGIVLGNGDGFAPNDNITREQIATILYRYMKYLGVDVSAKGDLNKFKDGKDVSSWAQDAMLWAEKVGLFQGDDQGNLNPRSNATRAEVATLMQRLVKMLVLK
ncbi:MAG: S-layer homology domain-containing protein [Oscillospiraceae bacterium]|nr:S-layer homology domain-containing protein [Oscillospiraceae bacterium]